MDAFRIAILASVFFFFMAPFARAKCPSSPSSSDSEALLADVRLRLNALSSFQLQNVELLADVLSESAELSESFGSNERKQLASRLAREAKEVAQGRIEGKPCVHVYEARVVMKDRADGVDVEAICLLPSASDGRNAIFWLTDCGRLTRDETLAGLLNQIQSD
ncbi:MAG: hypothetical protein AB7G93_06485 [Bdellovibrionales bacterium]